MTRTFPAALAAAGLLAAGAAPFGSAHAQDEWQAAGDTTARRAAAPAMRRAPPPAARPLPALKPAPEVKRVPAPPPIAADQDPTVVDELVIVAPRTRAPAAEPAPAYAARAGRFGDTEVRRAVVRYADLDTFGQAGATTLLRRISTAAEQVCSPRPVTPRQFRDYADWQACIQAAVGQAVYDSGEPVVIALYALGD